MSKLNIKTEWDLSELLKGSSDPKIALEQKEIEKQVDLFVKKYSKDKSWLTNSISLKIALNDYEKLLNDSGQLGGSSYLYFALSLEKNQNNTDLKSKFNKLEDFNKKMENKLLFFELGLSKLNEKQKVLFLKSKDLTNYKHFLERKFLEGKYLLSENEEKILSLKSSVSYTNWKKMISSLTSKEERFVLINNKKQKKNFSEITGLINDANKKTRDSAADAFNEIILNYLDVSEYELNSVLEDKKINDELRKMLRPDLSRHIKDDIDSKIVDVLIDCVSKKFELSKRYYKLKAKLFKVKQLKYHERNLSYGKIDNKYSFDKSVDLVRNTYESLDLEFAKLFDYYLSKGRIDVFPKKGKRTGAFCEWSSPSKPIYMLLNHSGELRDVLTIAHETGHAINAELSKQQNTLQFNIPTSAAEVASTFMEDFVLQELLKKSDSETKLAILVQKLNEDVSTIFRQIACYMFEQELHLEFRKKGYLSKNEIGKLFQKHMVAYMGPSVEQSKGSENWWLHWSHIRNYFYNYSYASGLLISKAMQTKYKKDPKFINKVKEFLSAGNSASPKDIFMKMGIDITKKEFWFEGLKEIEDLLNETEKLAKKLKKI
jgi:oligoendopeptidase F